VIEDAAHALPTTYRGRTVGAIGDLTAFSFYVTKTITTGEGGMVTTESDAHAARIRRMSLHGLSSDAWDRYSEKGTWYYEILDFGFKYNMTDVAAAMGLHQLGRSEALWKRRRQIALQYTEAFGELAGCQTPAETASGTHAWHLYILRVDPDRVPGGRDHVVRHLREAGIGTSVHFIPLHLHPAYRKAWGYAPGAFPVAENAFGRAVSLPIYARMTDGDVGRVIEAVREALGGGHG
jgi:perosamine synthetase